MTRIDSISNETLMADFAQFDLIRELTTTEGTGTYTVTGSAGGRFRRFSSKYANGERVCCYVRDGTSPLDASAWERFIGVYSNNTITRVTLIDSSTGSFINWGAGTRIVEVGPNPKRTVKAGTGCTVTNDNATSEQIVAVDTTTIATRTYVDSSVAALVDSSPTALDTLNELAAALGDDQNFATTMTNALAAKAPLASPAFTGTVNLTEAVKQTGRIIPPQLTANVNNYAPTGFATCSTVELSCDATPRNITGLAGGVHGRRVTLLHVSGAAITLKNADNGSSANNRFEFAQDLTLSVGDGLDIVCLDHSGDLRWYAVRIQFGATAHAASHKSGGSDPIKLDELAAPTDVTTLNVTTSAHGLVPKLTGNVAHCFRADGTYGPAISGDVPLSFHQDFIGDGGNVYGDFSFVAINTGTATADGGSPQHPGVITLTSAAMTNSGYRVTSRSDQIRIAGGEQFDCWFKTPSAFTDRVVRFGIHNSTTSSDAADGVYFEIPGSSSIVGKTASSSTRTTSSTVATLSTATWYHARIVVNSDATSITFTIYSEAGSSLGSQTITTNIPSVSVGAGIVATTSGMTSIGLISVDAIRLTFTQTLARGAA